MSIGQAAEPGQARDQDGSQAIAALNVLSRIAEGEVTEVMLVLQRGDRSPESSSSVQRSACCLP